MSVGDVSLACASVVVDELARAGMRHACVSPGSRSTPIALALDRHPDVDLHVHLDERSSAFFALGLSKATRSPVAVACTSGTAAAEFLPPVVEAFQSRVQLILLTADRPPRLRGTGANQTIDQVQLYGRYAAYTETPPAEEPVPEARLRALVRDAMRAAAFPQIPVHINMPFDEPLTPEGVAVAVDEARLPDVSADTTSYRRPVEEADALAREASGRRGVMVLGRLIDESAREGMLDLAASLRWPVLAEPVSGARLPGLALASGQALIGSSAWISANPVEVVLQVGTTPTTRATQTLVAETDRLIVLDTHFPEPDPEGRAALRIREHPALLADELIGRPLRPSPGEWMKEWLAADDVARRALDGALDALDEPTELRLARDLAAWVPAGGTLFVGNSMPIRDLDYAMAPREDLRLLANRGASGIDGLGSTALGVAAARTGPTVALVGDLSLLHDIGALFWSGRGASDLTIVVANNGGGTIFSFLPQRQLPEFERLFTTPHGFDIGSICSAAGAGHECVEHMGDFTRALERAATTGGVRVVEVVVEPTRSRAQHAEVQTAVDAALGDLL